ncbi:MAG: ABC transporter ATP-binding protein [Verrucomicrobiales bacterium]|nr:ABC transporter ATP-binding protein [Verrucomicrobiales bacterium]
MPALLEVKDLVSAFDTDAGQLVAVDGVSFSIEKGKTLGIVGESGSGKSVSALSVINLLPQPMGKILNGSIRFKEHELVGASQETLYDVRGDEIGMIFQEPMTALNPVQKIGRQVNEVFLLHGKAKTPEEARVLSIDILRKVGIPAPEIRIDEYPHQLSGGMRQRIMIAMALGCKPDLLIADEPTTALDVTVQAQILKLMKDLQDEMGMAVILITHDLGVIAETCDDVVVMYAGRVVERAPVKELFAKPRHAYTRGLLRSMPRLDRERKTELPTIQGNVPALHEMPDGCRFSTRAEVRHDEAAINNRPPFEEVSPGHWVEKCPFCFDQG